MRDTTHSAPNRRVPFGRLALLGGLLAAGVAAATLGLAPARAAEGPAATSSTPAHTWPAAWPAEVVDLFAEIPVQEGGRVKPLNTMATYALERMAQHRSVKTPDGRRIGPVEFLLDCLFFPESARRYECFLIDNDEVLTALGLDPSHLTDESGKPVEKKKRDYYAYEFLAPGRTRLVALARQYGQIEEKQRDPVQGGIVTLYHAVMEFEEFTTWIGWARAPVAVPDLPILRQQLGGKAEVSFPELVRAAPRITEALRTALRQAAGPKHPELDAAVNGYEQMLQTKGSSSALAVFPPSKERMAAIQAAQDAGSDLDMQADAWLTPYEVLYQAAERPDLPPVAGHFDMLKDFEGLYEARSDPKTFTDRARTLERDAEALARDIGKYRNIPREVQLFRLNPFGNSQWIYLTLFVFVAVSWFFRRRIPWYDATLIGLLGGTTLFVIWGIVERCLIREHPPMTNLYDTVLFVTATAALTGLVVEGLTRRRIALALVPLLGFLGLLVAHGYESITREDNMKKVVAVLDTNFWLSTHVTCIALGYMASLLAAAFAHVYVLGRVFGLAKRDQGFFRVVNGMTYGTLGFALILTTVGTILGGIWANESWGRFWGWDPKENGALMIVLWQLAMIHGRLGGILKPFGFAMATVALAGVVAFSWWGINLLGIGLHAYGFTQGVMNGLVIFYAAELAVLGLGAGWWLHQRRHGLHV